MGRIEDGIVIGEVELTSGGVFELSQGRRFHFVHRDEIERVAVGQGFTSERAPVLVGAGMTLVAVALWLIAGGVEYTGDLRRSWMRAMGISVFAAALGLIMLLRGLRRGLFLRLEGRHGEQRVRVGKQVKKEDVTRALEEAARRYGYVVSLSAS